MCHILKPTSATSGVSMSVSGTYGHASSLRAVYHAPTQSKSTFRLSPFRKVAKSARINLNRYWGLLSTKLHPVSGSKSVVSQDPISFLAEMEQNRINEMLEAQANATSQNSLNSQFEEEYLGGSPILSHHSPSDSPQPQRRFVRQPQRSLYSSTSSCTSPAPSSIQDYFSFDDSTSQDSVFL